MTELTDRDPAHDDAGWLVDDEPAPPDGQAAPAAPGRRTALTAVGLVAAGALVGGVGVAALRPHWSTNSAAPVGFRPGQFQNGQQVPNGQLPNGQLPNGQLPNGQLPNGQGFQGQGGGGVDGEQRVSGTVVSVGASSIRIHTNRGTASYGVTAQTEIVRNGASTSLSGIQPGDSVFVHLIPAGGSSYVVERLFATARRSGDAT